jgi:hypothetical protein
MVSLYPQNTQGAVPWFRQLVAGLSLIRASFNLRHVCVEFVVDKVALGHVFLRVIQFSPVRIVPPILHTRSFLCCRCYIISAVDSIVK